MFDASSGTMSHVQFVIDYVVIIAMPGPNTLALAATTALRGLRGGVPFCFGLALGAGSLCVTIGLASGIGAASSVSGPGRVVAAGLLIWVAWSMLNRRKSTGAEATHPVSLAANSLTAFGAAFALAALNPITAAYFLSAFLGSAASAPWKPYAGFSIVIAALATLAVIAGLVSRPPVRRAILQHDRAVRLVAALTLLSMAVRTLLPLAPI